MKIVVLGATGNIGKKITLDLVAAGHEVVEASRSHGVDAVTGTGLDDAFKDADAVVDCLHVPTFSKKQATSFFSMTTRHVIEAAHRAEIGQIVCVCIGGASDPKVNVLNGYYKGKAVQEKLYRESRLPVALIHSTQWFHLVDDLVASTSMGPMTILPTMRMAPVAVESVARLIAEQAVAEPPSGVQDVAIRGPEVFTGAQMARAIKAVRGSVGGRNPRILLEAPFLGRAIATDGLIPADAIVDDVTLSDWLGQESE